MKTVLMEPALLHKYPDSYYPATPDLITVAEHNSAKNLARLIVKIATDDRGPQSSQSTLSERIGGLSRLRQVRQAVASAGFAATVLLVDIYRPGIATAELTYCQTRNRSVGLATTEDILLGNPIVRKLIWGLSDEGLYLPYAPISQGTESLTDQIDLVEIDAHYATLVSRITDPRSDVGLSVMTAQLIPYHQ